MSVNTEEGIVISIHDFSDKNLIIKVLSKNNSIISGIFSRVLGGKYHIFDHISFVYSSSPGKELVKFNSIERLSLFPEIKGPFLDQYFVLAELSRKFSWSEMPLESFFDQISSVRSYLLSDFDPEFHLTFFVHLLRNLGYSPEQLNEGIYFDLRQGQVVNSAPPYPDYCDASFIRFFDSFHWEKRDYCVFQNASDRHLFFTQLLRFYELQSGHKIELNSIEILRQLRD